MFENPRRGRQARNFTTNAPKILDLKSSSEQIFSRKLSLGDPAIGFCCETLHQFWCETVTVIAWLTTYDYWLLLRNFNCTSSGVKLFRWSPDWPRTTIGFCCETLHQIWCETVTVIAWLITYDYWFLLQNFAPVLVWNCYGDRLIDHSTTIGLSLIHIWRCRRRG